MYGYIYITTNLINGKQYIGQHRATEFTESYKGSGKLIKRAFDKYGWDNFKVELLKECYSKEELDNSEIDFINKYNAVKSSRFYNIAKGGSNGSLELMLIASRSKEARAKAAPKIMETRRLRFNGDSSPWFRKPDVIRKRISTRKERYGDVAASLHTDESKLKAKQVKIDKYGSLTSFMMTPDARGKAAKSKSYRLLYDDKIFVGYSSLQEYINNKFNIEICKSALHRLSRGSMVKKYDYLFGLIKIMDSNDIEKYDGKIPTAKD